MADSKSRSTSAGSASGVSRYALGAIGGGVGAAAAVAEHRECRLVVVATTEHDERTGGHCGDGDSTGGEGDPLRPAPSWRWGLGEGLRRGRRPVVEHACRRRRHALHQVGSVGEVLQECARRLGLLRPREPFLQLGQQAPLLLGGQRRLLDARLEVGEIGDGDGGRFRRRVRERRDRWYLHQRPPERDRRLRVAGAHVDALGLGEHRRKEAVRHRLADEHGKHRLAERGGVLELALARRGAQ